MVKFVLKNFLQPYEVILNSLGRHTYYLSRIISTDHSPSNNCSMKRAQIVSYYRLFERHLYFWGHIFSIAISVSLSYCRYVSFFDASDSQDLPIRALTAFSDSFMIAFITQPVQFLLAYPSLKWLTFGDIPKAGTIHLSFQRSRFYLHHCFNNSVWNEMRFRIFLRYWKGNCFSRVISFMRIFTQTIKWSDPWKLFVLYRRDKNDYLARNFFNDDWLGLQSVHLEC